MLENLVKMSKDEIELKLSQMGDIEKQNLMNEINKHIEEAKIEKAKLEANTASLQQDEKNYMIQLAEYGINDYSTLDTEIERLEKEIDTALIEYVEKLKGE